MNEQVKVVLDNIKTALETLPVEDAKDLWWILSGLRGPDTESNQLKRDTSEVIRFHAFGSYAVDRIGAYASNDHPTALYIERAKWEEGSKYVNGSIISRHFIHHAKLAFEALGLVWSKEEK
jgi:hypothetical protein